MPPGPCILVIESDADILNLLRRVLEQEGFRTVVAGDCPAGLELIEKTRPDLVILGTGAPGGDVYQVLGRVRKKTDIPIILISTDNRVGALRRAISGGATDLLHRPFRTRTLVERIKKCLGRVNRAVSP